MAYSVRQTKGNTGTGTSIVCTWTSATVTGSTIFVVIGTNFSSFSAPSSVVDSQGNTYTLIRSTVVSNGNLYTYRAVNITGGSGSVTVNFSGSGQSNGVIVREYGGLLTAPYDVESGAGGNSTAAASGNTSTTTQSNELVVGAGYSTLNSIGVTLGAGFSNLTTQSTSNGMLWIEDKEVLSTGAQQSNVTLSQSWNWAQHTATFKESGAGAPPPNSAMLMMF